MNEVKSFIIGFSLSILGVSLYSQASPSTPLNTKLPSQNIKISLFKDSDAISATHISQKINKETILSNNILTTLTETIPSQDSKESISLANAEEIPLIDGIEDDEIININTEELIPITFNTDSNILGATQPSISEDKVALLPPDSNTEDLDQHLSPWSIAKGNLSPKNKLLPTTLNNKYSTSEISGNENSTPYNVAEKIKQSIIFPIPEEILSDENLTPTFIKNSKQTPNKSNLQIVDKKKVEKEDDKDGIIDNLSKSLPKKTEKTKKTQPSPVYNSQPQISSQAKTVSKQLKQTKIKNVGELYEAIQTTQKQNSQKKIFPTELKLTFNPDKAEISGQTLRWVKAFSEKAVNNNYSLKINLNASTPNELQRRRLNLLYTILSNNGIDVEKVDTAFSQVGYDTFIIRLIKDPQNPF